MLIYFGMDKDLFLFICFFLKLFVLFRFIIFLMYVKKGILLVWKIDIENIENDDGNWCFFF